MEMPKTYRVARPLYSNPDALLALDHNLQLPDTMNRELRNIFDSVLLTDFRLPNGSRELSPIWNSKDVKNRKYTIEHNGSENGELKIEYRPFSVKFGTTSVKARDLFTGGEHEGKRTPHPELNGYDSVISNSMDRNVASTISAISQKPSLGWEAEQMPQDDKVTIRGIFHDVGDGEVWYVPVFEIPAINRKALVFDAVTNRWIELKSEIMDLHQLPGSYKKNAFQLSGYYADYNLRCTIPFFVSGAVFMDGFHGNYLSANPDFVSDIFFDPKDKTNPKFTMKLRASRFSHTHDEIEKRGKPWQLAPTYLIKPFGKFRMRKIDERHGPDWMRYQITNKHRPYWLETGEGRFGSDFFPYYVFGIGKGRAFSRAQISRKVDNEMELKKKSLPDEMEFELDLNEIGAGYKYEPRTARPEAEKAGQEA